MRSENTDAPHGAVLATSKEEFYYVAFALLALKIRQYRNFRSIKGACSIEGTNNVMRAKAAAIDQ
jgi:hypothetical protein